MPQRIWPLLKLALVVFGCLALIDLAVFRSGVYAWVAAPESTAGSLVRAIMKIDESHIDGRRNILVLGDSRIGEGFSMPLANAASQRPDLNFINGSIAGTAPRIWNYLLREVDPAADRFSAIVLMVDYDLSDQRQNLLDRRLDTPYLRPLLRISDIETFPASFTAPSLREGARRAILFPMQAMHDDIRSLLSSPQKRFNEITRSRPGWLAATANYPGRDEALPQLDINPSTRMPVDWSPLDDRLQAILRPYFKDRGKAAPDAIQAENLIYMRRWLGEIAGRYAATGVPVFVFSIPRGPWSSQLVETPPQPNIAITELQANRQLIALPGDAFVDLEQPQYFFDELHMNRAGRELFSARLAQRIAAMVH